MFSACTRHRGRSRARPTPSSTMTCRYVLFAVPRHTRPRPSHSRPLCSLRPAQVPAVILPICPMSDCRPSASTSSAARRCCFPSASLVAPSPDALRVLRTERYRWRWPPCRRSAHRTAIPSRPGTARHTSTRGGFRTARQDLAGPYVHAWQARHVPFGAVDRTTTVGLRSCPEPS